MFGKGKEDGGMKKERRDVCLEQGIYVLRSTRDRLIKVLKKRKIGY